MADEVWNGVASDYDLAGDVERRWGLQWLLCKKQRAGAEERAQKESDISQTSGDHGNCISSGAKARDFLGAFMARLKSCPALLATPFAFFRKL
jgi:hypothetical protein